MDFISRQKHLRLRLADSGLDALLVTHLPNIRYLTGFTGSAAVLVATRKGMLFFTDGRYREQANQQVRGARVSVPKGATLAAAAEALGKGIGALIGIEADHMSVAARAELKKLLPPGKKLRDTSGIVEQQRMVKDADEIALIREAVALGSELLSTALEAISPGVKETDVAAEIEYEARRKGAEGMSFETIVAAGPRSALPHGVASREPIPAKGFVVLDFGVILHGYCSDMTRTVHVGKVGREERRIYQAVLESQLAAIEAAMPGAELGQVDAAARSALRKAKLDKYFTHSTGHGVGLEIHETPRVARGQRDILTAGTVITIEPGVYIPGRGGVRIEDMVVVTERGCEVLTTATKELIEL
jgi:Xaa-Pro aminopeptidase